MPAVVSIVVEKQRQAPYHPLVFSGDVQNGAAIPSEVRIMGGVNTQPPAECVRIDHDGIVSVSVDHPVSETGWLGPGLIGAKQRYAGAACDEAQWFGDASVYDLPHVRVAVRSGSYRTRSGEFMLNLLQGLSFRLRQSSGDEPEPEHANHSIEPECA